MQCKSCNEEISQKFTHSLSLNQCPFCGSAIMDEDLVIILSELREIMSSTEKYKVEMFEYLKTNYGLVDSNGDEYKAIVEKAHTIPAKIKVDPKEVKLDEKGNQLTGTPLQSQEATNIFFKRAQIKPNSISDIVSKINKDKSGSSSLLMGNAADLSGAEQEDIEAYNELVSGGVSSVPAIRSSIDYSDDGDEPLPAIAEALAQSGERGGGANSPTYNPRDVAKLQALQNKAKSATRELSGGGSVGLIRRS